MTYVKPHMTQALAKHTLEKVSEGVWRMRRPGGSDYRVLLTFNEEGIVLQGDIGLGPAQNGICSRGGYGIGWFGKPLSEDYLCSKFLSKHWQLEVAKTDIESWVQDARAELDRVKKEEADSRSEDDPEEPDEDCFKEEEKTLNSWLAIQASIGDETSAEELYEEGSRHFDDFWDYGVGHDYNIADAGWLCAIQQRFATLYGEVLRQMLPEIVITDHDTCGIVLSEGSAYDEEEEAEIIGPFDHVISIVGTWEDDGDPPGGWDVWNAYPARKLRLQFDDIVHSNSHGDAPTPEHVQQIIDFAKGVEGRVLIHCAAGVSRSSAAGLIVITTLLGPDKASDAIRHLIKIRNPQTIRPHRGMTQMADDILGCSHQLVKGHMAVWGQRDPFT